MSGIIVSSTYLQEPLHKVRWPSVIAPEVLLLEVGHDVRRLLPEVHRLLLPHNQRPSQREPGLPPDFGAILSAPGILRAT